MIFVSRFFSNIDFLLLFISVSSPMIAMIVSRKKVEMVLFFLNDGKICIDNCYFFCSFSKKDGSSSFVKSGCNR